MRRAASCLVLLVTVACGSSPTTPTPTPTPPAAPTVSTVAVTATGCTNGSTCAVASTLQLSAVATLSNGTTQSVTTQAQWTSTNPSVAEVSASGVVTARNTGSADVTAVYQGKTGGVTISVPPPFSQSGSGDNVFTIPSTVTRIRIDATYTGSCQNFIVRISTQPTSLVNVIIGTCSVADTRSPFTGTYAINNGGTVTITNSTGINWTFTQLR
jgi:hypothetical protein